MPNYNFDSLKEKLLENKSWPIKYMFKFIVPNKEGNVNKLMGLLPENAENSFKHTKNLRHVSVTCVANMQSVDDIIYITQQALKIDGAMSL